MLWPSENSGVWFVLENGIEVVSTLPWCGLAAQGLVNGVDNCNMTGVDGGPGDE